MDESYQSPDSAMSSCSVALCTYNGEKYLAQLLESILGQSQAPEEFVVVDDCSTDGTASLLQRYAAKDSRIKLHVLKSNLGPIQAFRHAIQLTSTPFIFLADQDDIWKPKKIETMLAAAARFHDDRPLLIYSDLEVMDDGGSLLHSSFWKMAGLDPHCTSFKSMMYGNVVTGCASLINSTMKELLVDIPSGVLMHDHWAGLIAYGFGTAAVLDEQLVQYRVHDTSVTEKSQSSIFWKARMQWNQLVTGNDEFLKKEINQMMLFDQKFRGFLRKNHQLELDDFIGLKDRSLLKRKIKSYLRNTK